MSQLDHLDQIAARAVDSVHVAVATRAPIADMGRLVAAKRRSLALRFAMGTAALVALVGLAGVLQVEEAADPVQPATTTTVVTTTTPVPEPPDTPGPVIPIPEGPVTTEPPVTAPPVAEPPATAPPVTEPPDTTPPPLTITSPENGAFVEKTAVTFKGTTEPGATVFSGQWEANVDGAGNWSIVLIVREGRNTARFTATDPAGNETSKTIEVFYEAPEPPKETAPLVAYAKFGTCELDPPYDIYYGTAEPGAVIEVTSEFGSGQTEVNGEGQWEIKVFFPEAPYGETFLVTVKDGLGGVKKFEFTSFAGGA